MGPGAGVAEDVSAAAARPAAERVAVLDALRGFALLGILLANIQYWSGWSFIKPPEKVALAGGAWTEATDFLHLLLIDGKFYTLFSFLFGLGFALQLARLEAKGANGVAIYRRRLLVLLAIGIVHMVLIWDGDILTLYALLGLSLPLFRMWSGRRLLGAAALLLLVPIPGVLLVQALGVPPHFGFFTLGDRIGAALGGAPATPVAWLQREEWSAYWAWVLGGWPYRFGTIFLTWRIPKVLAIMLIGLWAGRRLVEGRLLEDRLLLRRVAIWGALIGLPANAAYAMSGGFWQEDSRSIFLAHVFNAIGVVPLGLAYAAGFALLWRHAEGALRLLVAPGRMALTNYLSHSLLGIALFYGVGFGLVGRLAPAGFYSLALLIFAGQILFSHLWLARFEQGPMERLWRLGTYGRRRTVAVKVSAARNGP